MKPFSALMFPDLVTFRRAIETTSPQGVTKITHAAGEEMPASVQRNSVNKVDAQGRTYTQVVHSVRTQADVAAVVGDKFEYLDHILSVDGHTEPGGIGDVIWITPCRETR